MERKNTCKTNNSKDMMLVLDVYSKIKAIVPFLNNGLP